LELGLHFQSEEDCWVKIEMGNVSAIDDIEVESRDARGEEGPGEPGDEAEADDVPETRIRTLSSVTVSIGLK
jgi:ribonuclease P/MRP protein subunit POP7